MRGLSAAEAAAVLLRVGANPPALMAEGGDAGPGARLLGLAVLPHGVVERSERLIKGWYGNAYWEPTDRPGHGRIRINCLPDSPEIAPEVIRFGCRSQFA